jgi:hypothetical protein
MIDLAGFALAVLLIELTPGPNMAWLVTLTLAEGRRAGLGAITGIALGLAANALLSVARRPGDPGAGTGPDTGRRGARRGDDGVAGVGSLA